MPSKLIDEQRFLNAILQALAGYDKDEKTFVYTSVLPNTDFGDKPLQIPLHPNTASIHQLWTVVSKDEHERQQRATARCHLMKEHGGIKPVTDTDVALFLFDKYTEEALTQFHNYVSKALPGVSVWFCRHEIDKRFDVDANQTPVCPTLYCLAIPEKDIPKLRRLFTITLVQSENTYLKDQVCVLAERNAELQDDNATLAQRVKELERINATLKADQPDAEGVKPTGYQPGFTSRPSSP